MSCAIASKSVFDPVSTPPSFTIVLTDSIAAAEGSTTSMSGMTASLNGIDTEHPRIESARMPRTAPSMSSVVKAL